MFTVEPEGFWKVGRLTSMVVSWVQTMKGWRNKKSFSWLICFSHPGACLIHLFYSRSFIRFKHTNIAPTFLGKICITPLLIYNFQSRFWSHEIYFTFRQESATNDLQNVYCHYKICTQNWALSWKHGSFHASFPVILPQVPSFFNFAAVRFLCMAIYTSAPILKMTGKTCEIFCTLLFGNPTEEPL